MASSCEAPGKCIRRDHCDVWNCHFWVGHKPSLSSLSRKNVPYLVFGFRCSHQGIQEDHA